MNDALDVALKQALTRPLTATDFSRLGKKYEGKVRDNYTTSDGRRVIVATDRISAFDRVLGTLPLKGQVLGFAAAWWFEKTRGIAPNHVLSVPDPNVLVARECQLVPVEMVVRAYLTGTTSTSIWIHYEQGKREFCGHRLPDGLKKHQRLDAPILTPSTKAAHGDHDVSASRDEILSISGMPAADFDRAAELAMALFHEGQRVCAERGLILVDTKYEFGKVGDALYVIDELHTPDSSRYWVADEYEARFAKGEDQRMLDKENIRQWLIRERNFSGHGTPPQIPNDVRVDLAEKYLTAYERITGTALKLEPGDVHARIEKNLRAAGYL